MTKFRGLRTLLAIVYALVAVSAFKLRQAAQDIDAAVADRWGGSGSTSPPPRMTTAGGSRIACSMQVPPPRKPSEVCDERYCYADDMGNTASVAKEICSHKNKVVSHNAVLESVDPKDNFRPIDIAGHSQVRTMSGTNQRGRIGAWAVGDVHAPGVSSGLDHIRQAHLNKGLAFTIEERQSLGIHGLLPPRVLTQDEQMEHAKCFLARLDDDLNKYMYLVDLFDRNEKLFFRLLMENVNEMMPLVYTPTVGLACQKFGLAYRRPRGIFITMHDCGHVYEILKNWPENDVRAICVTDGERILGLGDLGANGMGIPIGKLALYTALAAIKPHQLLPILIDVGTNRAEIRDDPMYIGLREERYDGEPYDALIDEFMHAVVARFGKNTLVQWEDFGNKNAFRLLEKYRYKFCSFNDDIQGTAAVAVGGLLASLRLTKKKLTDNVLLFFGAGEASIGIAQLCVMAMMREGISEEEAKKKIWMVDSKGLIIKNRAEGGLTVHKEQFAQDHKPIKDIATAVAELKPTILIGASTIANAFTPEIIKNMAKNTERPVIFALSNPTIKAECTPEQVYTNTDGKGIYASGSPFPPLEIGGKRFEPGQGNNSYIFPGMGLAAVTIGLKCIPEEVFLVAAQALAEIVDQTDLDVGRMYPPLECIQEVSLEIAVRISEFAYEKGIAVVTPKPKNIEKFIKAQQYNPKYGEVFPETWDYPSKCAKPAGPITPSASVAEMCEVFAVADDCLPARNIMMNGRLTQESTCELA